MWTDPGINTSANLRHVRPITASAIGRSISGSALEVNSIPPQNKNSFSYGS
jgi:hypothetical protein